ncbi:TPA: BRO-N domain-containing protein, partial [Salmonella enterica]|nr:hypothetical protein [Salmonella enterica]
MPKHKNDEAPTTRDSQGLLSKKSSAGNIDMKSVSKLSKNENAVIAPVTFSFHESHDVRIQVIDG